MRVGVADSLRVGVTAMPQKENDLKVILLAGLRGSGKSLCGRALQKMLNCGYLDLDETKGEGMEKFRKFYEIFIPGSTPSRLERVLT